VRELAGGVVLATMLVALGGDAGSVEELRRYQVVGDTIPSSLTDAPGDAARGRSIVVNRTVGLCLLCHSGPFPEERFQGNLAPDLKGTGARWSAGALRLRIVDSHKLNADTIMPAYFAVDGLNRVAPAYRGKPILTAEQIEDVVAFLITLRD
jgi:L-cysteine S-thiosulfotransferase